MKFFLPLILFSFALSSCNSDDVINPSDEIVKKEEPKGKKVGNLIINESTVILDKSSMEKAKYISNDLVIFDSEPLEASKIHKGSIIIGVKNDGISPQNIMGRVRDIEIKNKEWYIYTESINVEDFILSGTLSGTVYMSEDTNKTQNKNSGKKVIIQDIEGFPTYSSQSSQKMINLPRLQHKGTYTIPIPNLPLTEHKSQISLTAGFTPAFDYTIKFGRKGISEFIITFYAKDILFDAYLKSYSGVDFDISVADMYSIPVFPIMLGPTGLIISPTISAGPYVTVKAGAAMDAQLFNAKGQISYIPTQPLKLPKFDFTITPFKWNGINWDLPKASAEGGLNVNAGFSLTFITTNLASIRTSPKIGMGSSIETNLKHTNINIYGKLSANAGLVLGVPPLKYEKSFSFIDWTPTLYSKNF